MNNRGQALVLFVLLLPLVTLLIIYLTEMANINLTKSEIDSNIKDGISYALTHISDDNVVYKTKLLMENNVDGDIDVIIDDEVVTIEVKKKINGIFTNFNKSYDVDITHIGYIKDNKKIIE